MFMFSVGLIGVGGMGTTHCRNLQENDAISCIGAVDLIEERRNNAAKKFSKVVSFSSIEKMIDEIKPQAFWVATPPYERYFINDLLETGLPVFMEKPVALNIDDCLKTNSVIKKNKNICAVGYHWRFLDFLPKILDYQKEYKSGAGSIKGYWESKPVLNSWWTKSNLSGGQVVEQATHVVDFMRIVGGEVTKVVGFGHKGYIGDDDGFFDAGVAGLVFENGTVGSVITSCLLANGNIPKAGVDVVYNDFSYSMHRQGIWISDYRLILNRGINVEEFRSASDLYNEEDQEFIKSIQNGQLSSRMCTYEEAVKSLNLCFAITEAIVEGKEVKVEKIEG
jgi:predicted dehydrogenase